MKYCIIMFTLLLSSITYSQEVKIVKLASTEWEPYFGDNLKEKGHFTKICKEAFKRVGYTMFVDFLPWKRTMALAKNKDIYHGIMGIYHTKEREKIFAYSDPVDKAVVAFIARKKLKIKYKGLSDLSKYRIGVVSGYFHSKVFEKATFLNKIYSSSTYENVKSLVNNRVDIVTDEIQVIFYYLKKFISNEEIKQYEVIRPHLKENLLYVTFKLPLKNPHLASKFNKGLKMIKEDGTYQKIKDEFDIKN